MTMCFPEPARGICDSHHVLELLAPGFDQQSNHRRWALAAQRDGSDAQVPSGCLPLLQQKNCGHRRGLFWKARCRLHGGLSTGPKTEAGRARIAEAQRRRWRGYREKRLGTSLG
jgi:hypothetical protein